VIGVGIVGEVVVGAVIGVGGIDVEVGVGAAIGVGIVGGVDDRASTGVGIVGGVDVGELE
jgi:hypothetical protein